MSRGYLPEFLQKLRNVFPKVFSDGGIEIGPIPAGTPIDLLANVNLLSEDPDPAKQLEYQAKVGDLVIKIATDLAELPENATDEQAREKFQNLVEPLLALSKCPDFIVNRGHYFGTDLVDADKRALIEFLKTF